MVAKHNGEEIPEDPFATMRNALEEEEKKVLLADGVAVDDSTPLVVSPEPTISEQNVAVVPPAEVTSQPLPEENISSLNSSPAVENDHVESAPIDQPQIDQPQNTISLDQILANTSQTSEVVPTPPTTSPSPSAKKQKPFNPLMIILLCLIPLGAIVAYMMMPDLFTSTPTGPEDTHAAAETFDTG